MKYVRIIARILVGAVFIYSGFVKIIDPLGSTYKFTDYFHDAFGMDWMIPASFALAVIMSMAELLVGLFVFFNIKMKLSALGALIFMGIFTPLTLFLAISDSVKDCGCFGDALILSNWETFYKNLIILVIVLFVFFSRKKYKSWLSNKKEWLGVGSFVLLSFFLSIYCYWHLPIIDFRPYKVGAYLPEQMSVPEGAPSDVYKVYYTMLNSETSETFEIDSDEYMADEKYWSEPYSVEEASEPVLVSKGYTPPIHDFGIVSKDGNDITDQVLSDERYYFLLISYDLNKASLSNQEQVNQIAEYCLENNYGFICMTASISDHISAFIERSGANFEFYSADEITLKTMIRSNPGLILLKEGTVIDKWHHNDLPDIEDLKEKYLK